MQLKKCCKTKLFNIVLEYDKLKTLRKTICIKIVGYFGTEEGHINLELLIYEIKLPISHERDV